METKPTERRGIRNIKIAVIGVAAIIVLIVILQNTEPSQTRVLFATITMPRAVLLVAMLTAGFVLGLVTAMKTRAFPTEAKS
jgi:uncharacterized integral membrane protein